MELVVREAKPEDMESILGLMQEAFAHHQAGRPDLFSPSLDPAAARPRIEALLHRPDAFNFLAEAEGRVVGQVRGEVRNQPKGLVHRERRLVWVDEVVVAKHSRMESVGRKLMERVTDWARERNAEAVSLEVYAFNDSARAFYQALGFEPLRLRLEHAL
jgi:ribosomal protein S18 acetylase RimI-like enzyme